MIRDVWSWNGNWFKKRQLLISSIRGFEHLMKPWARESRAILIKWIRQLWISNRSWNPTKIQKPQRGSTLAIISWMRSKGQKVLWNPPALVIASIQLSILWRKIQEKLVWTANLIATPLILNHQYTQQNLFPHSRSH